MTAIYLDLSEIVAVLNDLENIRNHSSLPPMLLKLQSKLACILAESKDFEVTFFLLHQHQN